MPIQFLEQKSSLSPDSRLSVNYLKCKINDIEVEFPYMNATKQDFDKSSEVNPLSSKYFQFFINQFSPPVPDITTECRQNQISTNFLNVIDDHKPLLTDITLYYDDHEVGEERRSSFLQLQMKLNTTFISDIEIDKNQSTQEFQTQLNDFDSLDTDQIKSPTISMSSTEETFQEKLNMIIDKKYDRFNVEWRGKTKYFDNWINLSKFLLNKKIICNVVSIHRVRNYSEPYESNVLKQFMLGASSCSTGYSGGGDNKKKRKPQRSFVLNENTWEYEENPEISYNLANTLSHNTLSKITHDSYQHILNDSYFDNFIPNNFQFESQ